MTTWIKWILGAIVLAAIVGGCAEQKPASLTGDQHDNSGPVDINGDLP
jgi:hypothetical protein